MYIYLSADDVLDERHVAVCARVAAVVTARSDRKASEWLTPVAWPRERVASAFYTCMYVCTCMLRYVFEIMLCCAHMRMCEYMFVCI